MPVSSLTARTTIPHDWPVAYPREKWDGFNGRVTDYLKQTEIAQDKVYYLCGNQGMIYDVYDILRNAGVSGDQIFTEAFFWYIICFLLQYVMNWVTFVPHA